MRCRDPLALNAFVQPQGSYSTVAVRNGPCQVDEVGQPAHTRHHKFQNTLEPAAPFSLYSFDHRPAASNWGFTAAVSRLASIAQGTGR